jgi:regulator of sigma E protease
MKGENEFTEAWENRRNSIEPTPGTFFGVSPFRRIAVSFAGPFFNFLFAALVLSVIWGIGFDVTTFENRVVLASDISGEKAPADEGGLQTGDRIIEINGTKTPYYREIQENIALNPEKDLQLIVDRNGETVSLTVRPLLESTGAGKIGVYFWADPVIETVAPGSSAMNAGLKAGDRVIRVNGEALPHTAKLLKILADKPAEISLDYERDGRTAAATLSPVYTEAGEANLGLSWALVHYRTPLLPPPAALAKGAGEAWKNVGIYLKGLSLLFRKIDLTQAVSGPFRITYMVGDIAAEGFGQSFGAGIRSMANFLALISIALCVMNLLPLPVLDGGMIVLFIVEAVTRKPPHPRAISVFQTVGVVIICGLMVFAMFGDFLYFFGR